MAANQEKSSVRMTFAQGCGMKNIDLKAMK
jgi:hypothetical protein